MFLDDDDPTALLTLVYVSDLADGVMDAVLADIRDESQRNNGRESITGLLVADGRCFAQLTEGPPPAMRRLKERIYADPRHRNIETLMFAQSGAPRRFADWQMGYLGFDAGDPRLPSLRGKRGVAALRAFDALVPAHAGWDGDAWPGG